MANIRKECKKFPGMKKVVKTGPKKKPRKDYGDFSLLGKIRPGMSEFQKRTMVEFFKVKEGETQEEWNSRTSTRRVVEIDEIKESNRSHKLIVLKRKREKAKLKNKNDYIVTQPIVKDFDYLRFYGILLNYYAIKYNIRKEDIEVGFYFYENIPFTRERFNNALVLMTGSNLNKCTRFQREGLLEEIVHTTKGYHCKDKKEKTGLFQLTKTFSMKLTYIYKTLAKMNGVMLTKQPFTGLPPEVKQLLKEMNEEVVAIQLGDKQQEKLT